VFYVSEITPAFRACCRTAPDLLAEVHAVSGQTSSSDVTPGVNPKDNIKNAEIVLNHSALQDGVEVSTLAVKVDYAFNSVWSTNVEIAVPSYRGLRFDEGGIGDVKCTRSWDNGPPHKLDVEVEFGGMIGEMTALTARAGTSCLDS